MPKNSQISTVSCLRGIFFNSISSPTPELSANSQRAPKIPPSVTSCMAFTPDLTAAAASGITDSIWSNRCARKIKSSVKRADNSSFFSLARIEVPSNPAHFVKTISIPAVTPDVDTSPFSFTFPIPVTVITGRITAEVTSVCPPMIWTFARRQASSA